MVLRHTRCSVGTSRRTSQCPAAVPARPNVELLGQHSALSHYPNISVAEYGHIKGHKAMMKEIYHRGPVACGIASEPLLDYETGIIVHNSTFKESDHTVSVVGWAACPAAVDCPHGKYWIVRNSWGEFWGDFGFARVAFGSLALVECSWATVGGYTAPERHNQFHCHVGGDNCAAS